jgi:hypothetical protein
MKIDYNELRNIKSSKDFELARHKLKLTQSYSLKRLTDEQRRLFQSIEPAKILEKGLKKIPFVNHWVGDGEDNIKPEGFMRYVMFVVDLSSAIFRFYR